MKVLVTGSAGHLGEALMRTLPHLGHHPIGLDLKPSTFTHHVGSIADGGFVRRSICDVEAVIHSATLHKPHVATHGRQAFIDTNITGTLNLLEEAGSSHVKAFVFTQKGGRRPDECVLKSNPHSQTVWLLSRRTVTWIVT